MIAVLADYLRSPLGNDELLNVGVSTGIIDNFLSEHFNRVVSIDIDEPAIIHARYSYQRDNLRFKLADPLNLPCNDSSFDVIICTHVYEHVPDPYIMFDGFTAS